MNEDERLERLAENRRRKKEERERKRKREKEKSIQRYTKRRKEFYYHTNTY
jgi:hypothetical protein